MTSYVQSGTVVLHFCPNEDIDAEARDLLGGDQGITMSKSFDGWFAMLYGFVSLWWQSRVLWKRAS